MKTFWIIILAGAALAVFAYWNRKSNTADTTAGKTDTETAAEIFNRLGAEAGKLALKPTGIPVPPQVTLSVV